MIIVPGLILVRLAKDQRLSKGVALLFILFRLHLLPSLDGSIWNFGRRGKLRTREPFSSPYTTDVLTIILIIIFTISTYFGILPNPHTQGRGKNRYLCLSSAFSSTYFSKLLVPAVRHLSLSLPLLDLFSLDNRFDPAGPLSPRVCVLLLFYVHNATQHFLSLVSGDSLIDKTTLRLEGPWRTVNQGGHAGCNSEHMPAGYGTLLLLSPTHSRS